MTRNLKALGLAMMAAFAMSAVMAGGAQAEEGVIEADIGGSGVADITGTPIEHNGSLRHSFTTGVGSITCEETHFDGTAEDEDKVITVTPTYETCTTHPITGGSFTTTVTMNGCDYLFTEGNATSEDPDHFNGITVSLVCKDKEGNPTEGPIIKVYKSATHGEKHEESNLRCEYTVHPFEHKLNNTAINTTEPAIHDVDVTTTVSGVVTTRLKGTFLQCGSPTQESTYTGGTTLRAYDEDDGAQVDLTLTDVG